MRCFALAINATLARIWLREKLKVQKKTLAICYSAFGNISTVARTYALEMRHLFAGIFDELHLFARAGMKIPLEKIDTTPSVKIHISNVSVSELVAFPGIKAPGLMGACADAVHEEMDVIVTIDGDARLPLFEIIPALAALLESETTDAVLGSRRVVGALVSKPGFRHLTSMLNASHVEAIMTPVLGHVRDPQAIFKIFRADRLRCALERLGCTGGGLLLNGSQKGDLAFEILFLANLTESGLVPRLLEVPAIETMAYPYNSKRMPILTSGNIKAMMAAANRPRYNVREYPLIGEGTESMVIRQPNGEVYKIPHGPERLAEQKLVPVSRTTDNRLLDFALSLPGGLRTLVCGLAGRLHPDRGFGIKPVVVDLITDKRPEVQLCLPRNMRWEYRNHASRLPFPSALILKIFWRIDRLLLNSGIILEWVGMQPTIVIRTIGTGVRCYRFIA